MGGLCGLSHGEVLAIPSICLPRGVLEYLRNNYGCRNDNCLNFNTISAARYKHRCALGFPEHVLRKQRSLNVEIGRADVMLMYFWIQQRVSFADVDGAEDGAKQGRDWKLF